MNVIVDTSVWSHVLRRGTPSVDPQAQKLLTLLSQGQPIMLLGVILQELLQGIRSTSDFEKVKTYLEVLPILSLDRQDYIVAAELRNLCSARGIQASTIDFQIAAACVQHGIELLTCDQDFKHIAKFCSLQLL